MRCVCLSLVFAVVSCCVLVSVVLSVVCCVFGWSRLCSCCWTCLFVCLMLLRVVACCCVRLFAVD